MCATSPCRWASPPSSGLATRARPSTLRVRSLLAWPSAPSPSFKLLTSLLRFHLTDWQIEGGVVNTSTVIENFDDILAKAPEMDNGFIVLEHDLYPQSVQLAVEYVLPNALAKGELDLMPIIDCLGMDHSEAYIETAQNATSGLVPTTAIVGASASGMVTGLTYTPVALGGGITQSGDSTLGYSAEESASAGSGGNKKSNKDNSNADDSDSDSSASAPIASLSLLLAVAFGSLGLWA